jgi:hypothetical protein
MKKLKLEKSEWVKEIPTPMKELIPRFGPPKNHHELEIWFFCLYQLLGFSDFVDLRTHFPDARMIEKGVVKTVELEFKTTDYNHYSRKPPNYVVCWVNDGWRNGIAPYGTKVICLLDFVTNLGKNYITSKYPISLSSSLKQINEEKVCDRIVKMLCNQKYNMKQVRMIQERVNKKYIETLGIREIILAHSDEIKINPITGEYETSSVQEILYKCDIIVSRLHVKRIIQELLVEERNKKNLESWFG